MTDSVRGSLPPRAVAIAPANTKFIPETRNEGKFVVVFEDGSFTAYIMDARSAHDLAKKWA